MIALPWSILLTLVCSGTGAYALTRLARLTAARTPQAARERIVEANHLVMSVLMVAMVWLMPGTLGIAVQVITLALFTIALGRFASLAGQSRGSRIALGAHIVGNLAMIWMLITMPFLMPGHGSGSGGHGDHGGHQASAPAASGHVSGAGAAGPEALTWVSLGFAVVLAVIAIAWLVHRDREHGGLAHRFCHAGMAGAMATMLVVMQ